MSRTAGLYIEGNIHWQRLFAVYTPPASHVAAEAQRPAHLVDGYTLAVAYQRDCRAGREALRKEGGDR